MPIVGWQRVTSDSPCDFCAMLASRGAVYRSEESADFEAHDHCSCTAEPIWERQAETAEVMRLRDQFERVTGGLTGKAGLALWRKWWRSRRADTPDRETVPGGAPTVPAVRPPVRGDLSTAERRAEARAASREIEAAAGQAEVLAELDAVAALRASPEVFEQRLRQASAVFTPAQMALLRLAVARGRDDLDAALARLAERAGLTQVGRAGARVAFDPDEHQLVQGATVRDGARVLILRPGFTMRTANGTVVISRPLVTPA